MARHLWALSRKGDTLWNKWTNLFVVKDQSIWHMRPLANASWTIQKICMGGN